MNVLVVDDEPEVRATVAEFLVLRGMEVREATNGLEALLHVKHWRPGAIVLDLNMPRLGGLDALKRIRAFDPTIAVVVVTAETDVVVHREALASGARAVLVKPVGLPVLLAALTADVPTEVAPAPPVMPSAATSPPPATLAGRAATSATRVLVVDDDDAVRTMLAEFLTLRGYTVSEASSAAAGIRMLAASTPDIMLLDVAMPGLSGADALATIRAVAPDVIVIMVSGIADEEVAKRTLALGAFDYIVKPLDLDYLAQALEIAVAMKALQ